MYIREKDLAVLSPEDIDEALMYDRGMKSTAVHFVQVNRKSVRVRKWFQSRDDKEKKNFDSIGTCGDIMFHDISNGAVHVTTANYSATSTKHYVMEEYTILSGGEDGEDIVRRIGVNGNSYRNEGGVSRLTDDVTREELQVEIITPQNG